MKPENTKRLTSICLAVLSVIFVLIPFVLNEGMPSENRFPNMIGFFSLFFCFSAIVVGVIAIIIGRSVKFRAGIIGGYIGAGIPAFLLIMLVLGFMLTISTGRVPCKIDMQDFSSMIQQYCKLNKGALPEAEAWCDQLFTSVENESIDSSFWFPNSIGFTYGPDEKKINYAFNKNLDGYRLADIDRQTVLLFETNPGWNQNGTSEIMLPEGHPGYYILIEGGAHFLFVGPDSTLTVKFIKNSEIDSLNWDVN